MTDAPIDRPRTVPHIAVVYHGNNRATETDVIFATEACRKQLLEHAGPAWHDWAPPPGIHYYGRADGIPTDEAAVVSVVHDARLQEAAGFHAAIGRRVFGVVDLSRTDSLSRTLSHECLEIYGNAFLDEWWPLPHRPGRHYAAELCDPVQRVGYGITVQMSREYRTITVGDFVLPAWSDPSLSGPKTFRDSVRGSFEVAPGGYQIAREDDTILYVHAPGGAVAASSVTRPLSRTSLITQGVVVPRG
jgi:hypothetical protein